MLVSCFILLRCCLITPMSTIMLVRNRPFASTDVDIWQFYEVHRCCVKSIYMTLYSLIGTTARLPVTMCCPRNLDLWSFHSANYKFSLCYVLWSRLCHEVWSSLMSVWHWSSVDRYEAWLSWPTIFLTLNGRVIWTFNEQSVYQIWRYYVVSFLRYESSGTHKRTVGLYRVCWFCQFCNSTL